MLMKYDLHVHSTASDGSLEPADIYARAAAEGLAVLALTDHDTLAGYQLLRQQAGSGPWLVAGIELSAVWGGQGVHIVGLDFDADHPVMQQAVEKQQDIRRQRGERIGALLARQGISGAYEGALAFCGQDPGRLGRLHFARYLVASGVVRTEQKAFDRWLGQGKVAEVRKLWPDMDEVVEWIRACGGVAVLAHPLKYRLTNAKLGRLLDAFSAAGGQAMEVVVSGQPKDRSHYLAELAGRHRLLASAGSDFHNDDNAWRRLGAFMPLPQACQPVLEALDLPANLRAERGGAM